jgi:TetR/AcrR family transcriptional regulator, regulator of autoinduction and epiphytic fitness
MVGTAQDVVSDGRVARGERTRRSLAEAMISLLEEGDPQPTARRIAERAGVSLRLVFHHFEDLESILRAAVEIQEHRHWRRIRPVEATLPLAERITRLVRQRTEVFQAVAPVRRSAALLEHNSPTVAAELARARQWLRAQLQETFAPELERAQPNTARLLLDALDVATSWETWEQLQPLGRTPAACRRTMEVLAGAVLGESTRSGGRT